MFSCFSNVVDQASLDLVWRPFFRLFYLVTRKMVRIGIIGLALSDPHFCILSRDCFNLSREYFSLWVIKTSLDRNASAVLERKCYFHASLVI